MAAFDYVASSDAGRQVRGAVEAADEAEAFAILRREGLRPLKITASRGGAQSGGRAGRVDLKPRAVAELLADLAALLQAGAALKPALGILAEGTGEPAAATAARALSGEISKGVGVEGAFLTVLGDRYPFVPGLAAAGEASGDLAGALRRGADILERDLAIGEEVGGALAYPAFVLLMTLASILLILLLVVPALAPIVDQSRDALPLSMLLLVGVSGLLTQYGGLLLAGLGVLALAALAGWRFGGLKTSFERLLLDGPARASVRGLVLGGFASAFGDLLSSGVPAPDALRIALRSLRLTEAARRLEPVLAALRGGAPVSTALAQAHGLPASLVHMARIGEESGALGPMLERAGKLEQARGLRSIKAMTRWLGPALIIVLGMVIGSLMAGLLSGVSSLGEAAVR
jgi:type II secretory pathway component PulF